MKKVLIALMLGCLLPLQMQGMFMVFGRIAAGAVKVGNSTGILPEKYLKPEDCLFPTDTTSEAWGLPQLSHPATSSNVKSDVSAVAAGAGSTFILNSQVAVGGDNLENFVKIDSEQFFKLQKNINDSIASENIAEAKKAKLRPLRDCLQNNENVFTQFNYLTSKLKAVSPEVVNEDVSASLLKLQSMQNNIINKEDLDTIEQYYSSILNTPDIDYASRVVECQKYWDSKMDGILESATIAKNVIKPVIAFGGTHSMALGLHAKDLAVPVDNIDYAAVAVGILAGLGISRSSNYLTTAACAVSGGVAVIIAKKLWVQNHNSALRRVEIRQINTHLSTLQTSINVIESDIKASVRHNESDVKNLSLHEEQLKRFDGVFRAGNNLSGQVDELSRDVRDIKASSVESTEMLKMQAKRERAIQETLKAIIQTQQTNDQGVHTRVKDLEKTIAANREQDRNDMGSAIGALRSDIGDIKYGQNQILEAVRQGASSRIALPAAEQEYSPLSRLLTSNVVPIKYASK